MKLRAFASCQCTNVMIIEKHTGAWLHWFCTKMKCKIFHFMNPQFKQCKLAIIIIYKIYLVSTSNIYKTDIAEGGSNNPKYIPVNLPTFLLIRIVRLVRGLREKCSELTLLPPEVSFFPGVID